MTARIVIFLLFSTGILFVPGCGEEQEGEAGRQDPAGMTVVVDTVLAAAEQVEVTVRSVGTVVAREEAEICAEVAGKVAAIRLKEGEAVKRGELLLIIDDERDRLLVNQARARCDSQKEAARRAEAEVNRARAVLDAAEETLGRKKALFDQGAETRAVYIDAKSARDSAAAGIAAAEAAAEEAAAAIKEGEAAFLVAEKNLADHAIKAPFDGMLGERLVSVGDYLESGDPVVSIHTEHPIDVEFTVPERHRAGIFPGQETTATFEAIPGELFKGEVTFISPQLDPDTRSVKVKALFANEQSILKPGYFCRVRLILKKHDDSTVVPESAIVPKGASFFVYVVTGGTARMTEVKLGERMIGKVQILEGLASGVEVIVAGHQKVSDGAQVKPRGRSGDSGSPEGG